MSVLEIVLYIVIGIAVATYITLSIIKMIKEKKNGKKTKKNKKETIAESEEED